MFFDNGISRNLPTFHHVTQTVESYVYSGVATPRMIVMSSERLQNLSLVTKVVCIFLWFSNQSLGFCFSVGWIGILLNSHSDRISLGD